MESGNEAKYLTNSGMKSGNEAKYLTKGGKESGNEATPGETTKPACGLTNQRKDKCSHSQIYPLIVKSLDNRDTHVFP